MSETPGDPTVFVDISMSLDGFITGPDPAPDRGLGERGEVLHDWVMGGPWTYAGGSPFQATGVDKQLLAAQFGRLGAMLVGRGTYDMVDGWGDSAPFGVPCFVLTHRPAQPAVSANTSFEFVTSGLAEAMTLARAACPPGKDISVMGGANLIQQAFRAGVVDELTLHIAPVVLGSGTALFEQVGRVELDHDWTEQSALSTHIRYRVRRPPT